MRRSRWLRVMLAAMTEGEQIGVIRGKRVSELSDSELQAELTRRRGRRGRPEELEPASPRAARSRRTAARGSDAQMKQYLANLGLRVDAGLEEIKRAYSDLTAKYDPEKFEGDSAKQSTAQQLRDELSKAYNGLLDSFGAGRDEAREPSSDDS